MFKFNFSFDAEATSNPIVVKEEEEKKIEKEESISTPESRISEDISPCFPESIRACTKAQEYVKLLEKHVNPHFQLHIEKVDFTRLNHDSKTSTSNCSLWRRHLLGNQTALASVVHNSDVVKKVYEGGFKLWECSVDLIRFLMEHEAQAGQIRLNSKQHWQHKLADLSGKYVADLGCGQGLPGVFCLTKGAAHVTMQDYNKEV